MRVPRGWLKRVAKVLETFCAEAAVLLLVFPVLDEFVQHGYAGVSLKLIGISVMGCILFLTVAMTIAALVNEEEH